MMSTLPDKWNPMKKQPEDFEPEAVDDDELGILKWSPCEDEDQEGGSSGRAVRNDSSSAFAKSSSS